MFIDNAHLLYLKVTDPSRRYIICNRNEIDIASGFKKNDYLTSHI